MAEPFFKQGMRVLVQGATGHEGQRAVSFMQDYHTAVVAGVTPGKGGGAVAGVPIFDTIEEARRAVGRVTISTLYVPPAATKRAVAEAVANHIPFIHILTEGVPYRDLAYCAALCRVNKVTLLGPGSLGILVAGESRVGMLGGVSPEGAFTPGPVSIVSRSGGMANELAHYLSVHGIGIRVAVHLGSEIISGLSLTDMVKRLYEDAATQAIVIFEEITHNDLAAFAAYTAQHRPPKKVIMHIAGSSLVHLPAGAPFGHLDALTDLNGAGLKRTSELLTKAGVIVVDAYEDCSNYLSHLL